MRPPAEPEQVPLLWVAVHMVEVVGCGGAGSRGFGEVGGGAEEAGEVPHLLVQYASGENAGFGCHRGRLYGRVDAYGNLTTWHCGRPALTSCHRLRAAVGECVVDDRRPKGRRQPLGHPEDVVRDVGACWVICPEEESNESYRAQMARTRCRPNGLPRAVRRPAGRSRCWGAVIGPTGGASAS